MTNDKIPFADIVSLHEELEGSLVEVFRKALKSGRFIGGPMVEGFEADFAEYCGSGFCAGVNSGTDALRFALIASGVKQGDRVITVPNTFIATTEAISQAGAVPVFVDVDERTYTMDAAKLAESIGNDFRIDDETGRLVDKAAGTPLAAVIPVHLYGQTAQMDPILELAEKGNLLVIEDACQAHGAEYLSGKTGRWRTAGTMGIAGAFSFYPGKNLGACGEGGAVTTDDGQLSLKIKMLRDHGQSRKYEHEIEGYNGRMDAIQAGLLGVKLKYLRQWTKQRRQCAARYDELLADIDSIVTPYVPAWTKAVHHLYVIRTSARDELMQFLAKENIDTGLHYPVPLHLQKAYEHLGYKWGDFPVSERLASEILSLPLSPSLAPHQQEKVANCIKRFASTQR